MTDLHSSVWNDERIEQLKRLHAEGLSCSRIATELGCGLSRNSIVGKLHRIGLRSIKPAVTKENSTPRAARRNSASIDALFSARAPTIEHVQPAPPLNDAEIPLTQRRTLVELGHHDCRWSCGDPDASDFFFCGAPAVDGFPYCRDHCERAYQPSRLASGPPRRGPLAD
jgi:GcrA cell cycle regulator